MNATTFLKEQIGKAIPHRFRNISELADKAGVNQPNLTELMNGKRKSMNLETAWKIMHALGLEVAPSSEVATIRNMGKNAAIVPAEVEGALSLNVYAVTGAGVAWEIQESSPIFSITAPPSYAQQSKFALLVDGESMYPTIKNGAVVGIDDDARFRQNEIFAVSIPYEGLTIKRVAIDHETNQYVLRSDNPDKEKYDDIRIFIEEAPTLLVGRVVWVWQGV